MLMLRELTHPLRNLLHNLINNLLYPLINLTILRNQITSMETTGHNLHRNILRALQGPSGLKSDDTLASRHGSNSPLT